MHVLRNPVTGGQEIILFLSPFPPFSRLGSIYGTFRLTVRAESTCFSSPTMSILRILNLVVSVTRRVVLLCGSKNWTPLAKCSPLQKRTDQIRYPSSSDRPRDTPDPPLYHHLPKKGGHLPCGGLELKKSPSASGIDQLVSQTFTVPIQLHSEKHGGGDSQPAWYDHIGSCTYLYGVLSSGPFPR